MINRTALDELFERAVRIHPTLAEIRERASTDGFSESLELRLMVVAISSELESQMAKNVEMALHVPPGFFLKKTEKPKRVHKYPARKELTRKLLDAGFVRGSEFNGERCSACYLSASGPYGWSKLVDGKSVTFCRFCAYDSIQGGGN